MTLVKICGIVDPDNARMAVDMGADFLGLNFYLRSPRYVEVERAREIASAVRGSGVRLVGVFVNRPAHEVAEVESEVGLDLLQLSGDETPEEAAPFAGRTIKAFRGTDATEGWSDAWAWLFDAPHGSLYGGTGMAWNFQAVAGIAGERRVFLAGGLGPDNVRQAIEASRAFAVDVCSRVESAPGIKDPELLRQLFQEVRNAQSQTPP
ncbi:MAG TPA: phosphoribosylanthranilate isomerase [Thermoanaerobaculia bacterium]|jgi:phosphoribosylanthranilate isomerase|nr:phosphoribosylanthranilate isomerase [Thermoanaerobaculia bacterium]